MPNTHFQFKQFRIDQGQCAMKVTTEGCLLGALVTVKGDEERVLDIGAGTGLLSLMIAQRSEVKVDAVEVDEAAARQAAENFSKSPWKDRLFCHLGRVQAFAQSTVERYDLVVSNPPFFKGHLKSGQAKDRAIHNDELSFGELAQAVSKLLTRQGRFWVLYPAFEFGEFTSTAEEFGLELQRVFEIYDRPGKAIFRKVGVFVKSAVGQVEEEVIFIKKEDGEYCEQFRELLKGYYLHL